jgi:hypothetical protein
MSPSGEICLERGNFMLRTRRSLTVLALFALLVLLPALAGARPAATPRSQAPSQVQLHATAPDASLLGRLLHGLRSLWGREGMTIDPNGTHVQGTTGTGTQGGTVNSDAGMLIDPNG